MEIDDQSSQIQIILKKTTEPSVGMKMLAAGSAACIADLATFPLDVAKVRLQIQGEGGSVSGIGTTQMQYRGVFGTLLTITRQEGPRALYGGIVPGLQRQMIFASVRIGLYDTVKIFYINLLGASHDNMNVSLRILAGITTGAMAILVGQPTDVVKVRMQAQRGNAPKRYNGSMQAYRTIARTEGVRGLWKGTTPNVARNAIVNASELVSYDLIKTQLLRTSYFKDNMFCHFVSAFGAGFCTTVIASPVDVIKTRFMNSPPGQYNGVLHCAKMMYQERGLMTFYKGFMPSFMRLGSWNIVMFVSFEQLKRLACAYQDYRLLKSANVNPRPSLSSNVVV